MQWQLNSCQQMLKCVKQKMVGFANMSFEPLFEINNCACAHTNVLAE